MKVRKSFGALALILSASALLAACGSGLGTGGSTAGATQTGSTITLTGFNTTSVTGLVYNTKASNLSSGGTFSLGTIYVRAWTDSTGNHIAALSYYDGGATEQYLSFDTTANGSAAPSTWYDAGNPPAVTGTVVYCHVSGSQVSYPTCSSLGISVNRAAGTFSVASTPAFDMNTLATGTMSGSLTFPPF